MGHGHLDAAWLWPLAETRRKMARTLSHQLTLAELFPTHKFQQSQPGELNMLLEDHPELFARVQQGAADGNIVVDGASWVEPDCNVTGGESLVRQFVHGKAFFREHFGVDSQMFWVPDSFGFSGAIPQIMKGCGVKYFSTGKLYWSYHGGEPFPHGIFTWEGIDGSQVLAEMLDGYNNETSPEHTYNNWAARRTQDARVDQRIFPFGEGDGGAGPGFPHLAFASRQADLLGLPKFVPMAPGDSFDMLAAKTAAPGGLPLPVYAGELYFQCHRGTLTSQAKTKLGNRLAEISLREVEMWASAALAVGDGFTFPADTMAGAWQTLLLNQFHDILPGSSIERVHAEAEAAFDTVCQTARDVAEQAVASFVDEGCPDDSLGCLTVFNSLSWDRPVLVQLPTDWPGAAGANGQPLPMQRQNGFRLVEVQAPSCGWTTITKADDAEMPAVGGLIAGTNGLENEHLAVRFNDLGQITSLVDKATGREFIGANSHPGGLGNELKLYKDVPTDFDAWDIDSMYEFLPIPLESAAEIDVVTAGPLLATLRVTRDINGSPLTQHITLRRDSRRLDFHTVVEWDQRHKLLKVGFDTNLRAHDALHEIQFGYLPRPTHRSRQFDADRFEVCNHKWTALAEANRGLAVLNDCKYGVSVLGGQINLTLLKSAMAPDKNADRGRQEFTYSVCLWDDCSFFDSGLTREAYDLNIPPSVAEGSPAECVSAALSRDTSAAEVSPAAATTFSMFAVDAPNIIIETVKP
ncbi:MAG: alpha-mannosidase, partial [Planctomycetota bacterium]